MGKLEFRTLTANEIECRVGQVKKDNSGFSLLLYKTARVDANLLDDVVGCYNWQKKFYQVKNTMICSIGIYFEDRKEWVWKDDGGAETDVEATKGECSDAMKRAGFQWGIGRELYNTPFIWVKTTESNQPKGVSYSVKDISYNDKRDITNLTIVNDNTGEIVYSYPRKANVSQNAPKQQNKGNTNNGGRISAEDLTQIELYLARVSGNESKRTAFFEWLENTYGTSVPANLSAENGKEVANKVRNR